MISLQEINAHFAMFTFLNNQIKSAYTNIEITFYPAVL